MEDNIKQINKTKNKIKKTQNKLQKLLIKLNELNRIQSCFDQEEINNKIKLNEKQKEIVQSTHKNILVLACPGSGKTHTLISRYIYLTTKMKIDPQKIILITFTKKAGNEMLNRISNYLPDKLPYYVGTFHGLAFQLLQKYNIADNVLDDMDSKQFLYDIIDEFYPDFNQKQIVYEIFHNTASDYPINIEYHINKFNQNCNSKIIKNIYKKYNDYKIKQRLLDFNDLMIQFNILLQNKPEITKLFDYVFFDEYQDINPIQNNILTKFNNSNIMAVGDDAQAIYSFRGSSVKFILDFDKYFPNSKMYKLETNYRSSTDIVNFCNDIIKYNYHQYDKTSIPDKKNNIKPNIIITQNSYDYVIKSIKKLNTKLSDIVILARTNKALDNFEISCNKNNIPVIKQLSLSLLNKNHIKDFLAFITILINNNSTLHFKRIISLHKNINDANKIINNNNKNIIESIKFFIDKNKNYKKSLSPFISFYQEIINIKDNLLIGNKIIDYIKNLYIIKKYNKINNKIEDMKQLLIYLKNYTLQQFINEIHLNLEIDCNVENSLLLSTIHGAKGLEWKYVYLIDSTPNNFPMIFYSDFYNTLDLVEEERRLLYVACSRPIKELTIVSDSMITPFIKHINKSNYSCNSIIKRTIDYQGNFYYDIPNYINGLGYYKLFPYLEELKNNSLCKELYDYKNIPINNNFFKFLAFKILKNKFNNKVIGFTNELFKNINTFNQNYLDIHEDWKDNIKSIYKISFKDDKLIENFINKDMFKFYNKFAKILCDYKKNNKTKKIYINQKFSYKSFFERINFLFDDRLFIIKQTNKLFNLKDLLHYILQAYICNKNKFDIKYIDIFMINHGKLFSFDLSKINPRTIHKIIYF